MIPIDELERLPPKLQTLLLEEEKLWRARRRKFYTLFPDEGPYRRELYPKQMSFFRYGVTHRQRGFMAANRIGKTIAALYEAAAHMTGRYPHWWVGRRYQRPVKVWLCGDTGKSVRDGIQDKFLGDYTELGTGILPGEDLVDTNPKQGIPEAVDNIRVKHYMGGRSMAYFKSYDQGREAFQFTEVDIIILDEEPPQDIYEECLTRTLTTNGMILLPFTPLNGVTEVVKRYLVDGETLREGPIDDSRALIMCSWDDVPHLSEDAKRELSSQYQPHMRDARTKGIPVLGSGMVFPVVESQIVTDPISPIPKEWVQLGGMDFGMDHPFGAAHTAWDRDEDTFYVMRDHRARDLDVLPELVWPKLRGWGDTWMPWAWPHDGLKRSPTSGKQVRLAYKEAGFNMLELHAQFDDKTFGLEAGILQMLTRMKTGRWKVFRSCVNWLSEYRTYHRKDGIIVPIAEDVISASRYAYMMRRYGRVAREHAQKLHIPVGM